MLAEGLYFGFAMHFYVQVPVFFTSLCVPDSKIRIVYYQSILIKPPSRTRSAVKTAHNFSDVCNAAGGGIQND